jgi:hypothetical protein
MDQKQYLNFRDMIDGGGAGAAGREFQGGGLLSMLGNLFARPLGSDAMQRPPERPALPNMTPAPLLQPPAPAPTELQYSGRGSVGMPMPPAPPELQYSGRGSVGMPMPPAPTELQYSGRGSVGMPMPQSVMPPASGLAGGRGTVTGPSIGQAFTQRLNAMFPPQQIERMAQRGDLERLFQQFVQTGKF